MGYLYIGLDKNDNIKIGMTEQTLEKRYGGTDYCIILSAETKENISREQLFKCEHILRIGFAEHYPQVSIDRFKKINEQYLDLFQNIISEINKKINLFQKPCCCNSLKTWQMFGLDRFIKLEKTLDK